VTDDVADLGLTPRPQPSTEVLAILASAVDQAWPRPVVVVDEVVASGGQSWRFSGRWWAQPMALRRNRPSAQR
jgi:hypothetical protein